MKLKALLLTIFFFGITNQNAFAWLQTEVQTVTKEESTEKLKKEKPKKKVKISQELNKRANELAKEQKPEQTDLSKLSVKNLGKVGDKLASKGSFYNALDYYSTALSKSKKERDILKFNIKLGDANFFLRDYGQAEMYYVKALSLNKDHRKNALLEFKMADTYKHLAKYKEAIQMYQEFANLQEGNRKTIGAQRKASLEKQGAEYALTLSLKDLKYSVENAGENVNGAFSDYGPELLGNNLFFSKIYTDKVVVLDEEIKEKEFSKIYFSELLNNEFNAFQNFTDKVNQSKVHIGNPSFAAGGNLVYFTECTLNEKMQSNCIIKQSERIENEWQEPTALNFNINFEKSSNTQPQIAITPEGKEILFFVSNRAGGRGGKDLWMSIKNEDGIFGTALPLSGMINTPFDEISPYYHTATNTLYFSSNGHINIGGFDVFKVEDFIDNEKLTVKNLGYPINSSLDDYDFILNAEESLGFLVSNRIGTTTLKSATCCDDIFVVESAAINLFATGLVIAENQMNKKVIENAELYLYNAETNEKIERINYTDGKSYLIALEKDMNYKIVAVAENFEEEEVRFNTFNLSKSDTFQYDIFLKKRDFQDYVIGKVYYQYDVSKLREDAPETLRKVVNFMNAYPDLIVEISSHTDSKGTDEYNMKLSEKRSISVRNYLINVGKINKNRLVNKFYGESKPAAPNTLPNGSDNPEGRDLNRRTEFIVIGKISKE